jgi:hypothetical protein
VLSHSHLYGRSERESPVTGLDLRARVRSEEVYGDLIAEGGVVSVFAALKDMDADGKSGA